MNKVENTQTKQIIWINPNLINGTEIVKSNCAKYNFKEIEDAANWIYFYKTMKDSCIPDDQILDIKPIAKAYDIFFTDMIKVSQKDGKFILSGDSNDQRVLAALFCHTVCIPVLLINNT